LNRFYDCIDNSEIFGLTNLFNNPKIDKKLLASTIRCIGREGEKLLNEELRKTKDKEISIAILNALAYRKPIYPNYLEIKLEASINIVSNVNGGNHELKSNTNSLFKFGKRVGEFCNYFGK